ncbi:hypothetical protein TRUGW13939_02594 [Talaromyces rugulosus]|uniref:Uncharacterized protein n=1 Tax=Talaromyces rugulosus TaxID=121627 RepID=A0A7H8QPV3_TALRU|nr:hypothetical protein TRUGW13939_02594 [Talaromyces rugulosus]
MLTRLEKLRVRRAILMN